MRHRLPTIAAEIATRELLAHDGDNARHAARVHVRYAKDLYPLLATARADGGGTCWPSVGSFCRQCPGAEFVTARDLCRNADERPRRWPRELLAGSAERYGAGIVVTRGEDRAEDADSFAGLAGEHVVGIYVGLEIEKLVRLDRPVGWHAVVFPATYWLARFAVEPFTEIQPSRYARLLPDADAERFRPAISPWPVTETSGA